MGSALLAAVVGIAGAACAVTAALAGGDASSPHDQSSGQAAHAVMVPNVTLGGAPGEGRAAWAPPVYGEMPRQVIGRSVEGRDIVAYTVGSGPRLVVLIGGLHAGAEALTVRLLEVVLHRIAAGALVAPDDMRLVIIPLANPDGWVHDTRTNANDVDLNRNWPTPDWAPVAQAGDATVSGGRHALSEPEVASLYRYLLATEPELVISYHGLAALTDANETGQAEELAERYATSADYQHIPEWTAYPVTGELIGAMAKVRIPAFDVELASGDALDVERNIAALRALLSEMAAP